MYVLFSNYISYLCTHQSVKEGRHVHTRSTKLASTLCQVIQPLCFCCQNESFIALRQIDWGWKPPWEGMGTTSPSPALFKSRPSTHSHDAKLLHNTTLHCFHQTIMKVTVSPLTVPAAVKITVESGVTSIGAEILRTQHTYYSTYYVLNKVKNVKNAKKG